MSFKVFSTAVAVLAVATPLAAQQSRGTMEFGAFTSGGTFANSLTLAQGVGAGGRIGMFFDRRWSLEFEPGVMKVYRQSGLSDVVLGTLTGRLVADPIKKGPFAFLIGAGGGVSTQADAMHSWGADGLLGAKIQVADNVNLRMDAVWVVKANQEWGAYRTIRIGLSFFRYPGVARPMAMIMDRPEISATPHDDSLSPEDVHRLHERIAALQSTDDSLRTALSASPMVAAEMIAAIEAPIQFQSGSFELDAGDKVALDLKVASMRRNRAFSLVVTGYADASGNDASNKALALRRAEVVRDYLVAGGVAEDRVIVEAKGEVQIPRSARDDSSRRVEFRLLIEPAKA